MASHDHANPLPSLLPLVGGMGACVLIGTVAGAAIGAPGDTELIARCAGGAAAALGLGATFAIVALAAIASKQPSLFALVLVGGSILRALVGLGAGLAMKAAAGLPPEPFWYAFLGGALLCLVFETIWGMLAARRMTAQSTPAGSPSHPTPGPSEHSA